MKKIVLVTGGFDPIHSGHIAYVKEAKRLGDLLAVGINSDDWLSRKKGQPFLPFNERSTIVNELKDVDFVVKFDDADNTACNAIEQLLNTTTNDIIFANGGDRNQTETPEYVKYKDHPRVEFKFGIGGTDKKNSSSWILDKWKHHKTDRDWGYWRVLDDKQPDIGLKTKELVINPGHSLSDQKHQYRAEHWYVLEGEIQINLELPTGDKQIQKLTPHMHYIIQQGWWHKTTNIGNKPAHIIEVQYGEKCIEEDIERR